MRIVALLPLLALAATGASPPKTFVTGTPLPDFAPARRAPPPAATPPGYTSAPTPDQDAFAPQAAAPSKDASVAPGLFSRRDQYRGEGISASSSAQIEQDRRAKPGAGIKLSMPLQ